MWAVSGGNRAPAPLWIHSLLPQSLPWWRQAQQETDTVTQISRRRWWISNLPTASTFAIGVLEYGVGGILGVMWTYKNIQPSSTSTGTLADLKIIIIIKQAQESHNIKPGYNFRNHCCTKNQESTTGMGKTTTTNVKAKMNQMLKLSNKDFKAAATHASTSN